VIRNFLLAILFGSFVCAGGETGTLNTIEITGTEFNRAALLGFVGLQAGASVTPASLKSACEKLKQTGLFELVEYEYQEEPDRGGYDFQIHLRPPAKLLAAAIEIPGVPSREIWDSLQRSGLYYLNQAPASDSGQKFYAAEIERILRARGMGQTIVAELRTGLIGSPSGKKLTVVFRPGITR
jgi:hypothetical protein